MSSTENNGAAEMIKKALTDIQEMSPATQIAIGGLAGLTTGYVFSRIGKLAAFSIGSSIILLQVAQQLGYIEIKLTKKSKLDELKKKALKAAEQSGLTTPEDKSARAIKEAKKFLSKNITFGLSFGGGFLIGFSF